MIDRAFFRTLTLHITMCVVLIIVIIVCVFASKKKDSMALFAIVTGIFLVFYCVGIVAPLVKDYIAQDVIQVEAVYINTLGDKSKSISSVLGEYSVILETDAGKLSLTTAPFSRDIFPAGEYTVTAWYTKNSQWLLYIEIHDT